MRGIILQSTSVTLSLIRSRSLRIKAWKSLRNKRQHQSFFADPLSLPLYFIYTLKTFVLDLRCFISVRKCWISADFVEPPNQFYPHGTFAAAPAAIKTWFFLYFELLTRWTVPGWESRLEASAGTRQPTSQLWLAHFYQIPVTHE